MVSDKDEFCSSLSDLLDEARKLPASNHSGFVDDEHIPRFGATATGLPTVFPGRKSTAHYA
ncbi:hypothetical protein AF71_00046790 [Rhizobium sp. 57MFTsu3.2]|nr:hypothetical protein [Rhizobium sp. 57MFTsu3.2]